MRENKKQYYGSLNVNRIADNKNFWRLVKRKFSSKKLIPTERDGCEIISDTEKVVDTFNKFL